MERERGPGDTSSKDRPFGSSHWNMSAKNRTGLLRTEIAPKNGFGASGGPRCGRKPPIRSNLTNELQKESNKSKWVRRSNQININFISAADFGIPNHNTTKDPT